MPSVQKRFKDFFGKEPEHSVDPMECVAIGASIQGGIIAGDVDDLLKHTAKDLARRGLVSNTEAVKIQG